MHRSELINELAAALAKAQAEIRPAKFDATNPHFRAKYATLASIQDAVRGPLTKNGLSYIQAIETEPNGDTVLETMLMHTSGQWASSKMKLVMEQITMQKMGSALTYARRYSLQSMAGVVGDEDDDGNAASEGPGAFKRDPMTMQAGAAPSTTAAKPNNRPQRKTPPPNMAPMSADVFAKQYMGSTVEAKKYVCKFGKYQGKAIAEIPTVELGGYCEYLYQQAKQNDKPIAGVVKEFLMAAEFVLAEA